MWISVLLSAAAVAVVSSSGLLLTMKTRYAEWLRKGEEWIIIKSPPEGPPASLSSLEEEEEAERRRKRKEERMNCLPKLVQRYLERVLPSSEGPERNGWRDPMSSRYVHFTQRGLFAMKEGGEKGERYVPFEASQFVSLSLAAFSWTAKMRMLGPFLSVTVCDRIIDGQAALQARVYGVLPVAKMEHSKELMQGELQRYLAEIVFYPSLCLLSPSLRWKERDQTNVEVSLTVSGVTASVILEFKGEGGLISKAWTEERNFTEPDGSLSLRPWEALCKEYKDFQGFLLPSKAEVSWLLPSGKKFTYFKGEILEYQCFA